MARCRRLLAAGFAAGVLSAVAGAPALAAPRALPAVNDPYVGVQWSLDAIGVSDAWRVGRGAGITVAVIDSGVASDQEDLQDGAIVGSVSCLDTGGDPSRCTPGGIDDYGHGTHVAGIIAANADNGRGITGVAPDASILSVKVLRIAPGESEPSGTSDDVAAGIVYAADHGARVLNLSLGSFSQSLFGPAFADAITYAWNKGAIPVVAAGNSYILGSGFSNQPAIVVGALNRSGTKASYGNGVGGAKWALSAPGGEPGDDQKGCLSNPQGVLSTFGPQGTPNGYACIAGTSMAAPHVSGTLAILLGAGASRDQAKDRVLSSARDLGLPGSDSVYGAGALDAGAAVAGLAPATLPTAPPPTEAPEPPAPTAPPASSAAPRDRATPPAGAAPGDTTPTTSVTMPAAQVTLPSTQVAIQPVGGGSDVPGLAVTAAVALVVGVGSTSGWLLIRGAGWARRTPG